MLCHIQKFLAALIFTFLKSGLLVTNDTISGVKKIAANHKCIRLKKLRNFILISNKLTDGFLDSRFLCHWTFTFNHNQWNSINKNNNIRTTGFLSFYRKLIHYQKFISFNILIIYKINCLMLALIADFLIDGNARNKRAVNNFICFNQTLSLH